MKFIEDNLTVDNIFYKDLWELFYDNNYSLYNRILIPEDLLNLDFIP